MKLQITPKSILRPVYRKLRKVCGFQSVTEAERKALVESYNIFTKISRSEHIDSITFNNAFCIYELQDGRKYYFDPREKVSSMYSVSSIGTFETKETVYLKNSIIPDSICFDVGANFGWYSILLANLVGDSGLVHAFEPIPNTYEVLRRNQILNDSRNLILNNCALGESVGVEELYIPDIGVSGSLKLHEYDKSYTTFNCKVDTIDSYCAQVALDRLDFLKADIEGAELQMLKGGLHTIKKYKPKLLLEIQEHSTRLFDHTPLDVFDFLSELGYSCFRVNDRYELESVDMNSNNLPDYNFIFIANSQ